MARVCCWSWKPSLDRFAAIASYTDRCDRGNVDPTGGRRFYSKALRKGWKQNLQTDEYTIDPVPSPRNSNWFLLIKWFNLHLKRIALKIPVTPPSTFEVNGKKATFTVTPEDRYNRLLNTKIYYSYNPNARTLLWNRADAGQDAGGKSRSAKLAIHKGLPLYSKDDKELEWSRITRFYLSIVDEAGH